MSGYEPGLVPHQSDAQTSSHASNNFLKEKMLYLLVIVSGLECCLRFSKKSSTPWHSKRRRQRTTAIRTFLKPTP